MPVLDSGESMVGIATKNQREVLPDSGALLRSSWQLGLDAPPRCRHEFRDGVIYRSILADVAQHCDHILL